MHKPAIFESRQLFLRKPRMVLEILENTFELETNKKQRRPQRKAVDTSPINVIKNQARY